MNMAEGNALQKYAEILGQTFLYASGSTVLALILGVLLAASLFRVGFRGARVASVLLAVAAFLPLHIYAAAWLGALSAPAMARADRSPSTHRPARGPGSRRRCDAAHARRGGCCSGKRPCRSSFLSIDTARPIGFVNREQANDLDAAAVFSQPFPD